MTYLLAAGLIAATAGVLALALLARKDASAVRTATDLLDATRKERDEWRHKTIEANAALKVATDERAREKTLRAIAEARANAAQARVLELLRTHMKGATDDEIRAAVDDLFAVALNVVPTLPDPNDPRDRLLDPFDPDV